MNIWSIEPYFVALFAMSMSSAVLAEANPTSIPREPKLVVYQYDNNLTYPVISAPGMVTDISLSADEKLQAFALGDTVQWVPAKTEGHVFLKPTIMRDGEAASRLSLDRYDLIRARQQEAQPAPNLLIPLKDAPVLPPLPPAAAPAAAPAASGTAQ